MKITSSLSVFLATAVLSSAASAEMVWSDFSISYLEGSNYEAGDPDRQVITIEHASAYDWGDNFFFIDRLKSEDGTKESYFEVSPRFSLGKLTGSKLSFGPVSDILLAGTWEAGEGFNNFLYGVGVSLDVPGFQYLNFNVYKANNEFWEDDEHVTLVWGTPFSIGPAEFVYDGFVDWSSSQDDHASEMNFTSQLKWNVGKLIDTKSPIYVGLEYVYWDNKFGIEGLDERNPNIILKWHF